jgi:malonyl-CoA O-methyltransferase
MTDHANALYDRWAPVYPATPHNSLMVAEHRAMTGRLLRLDRPASALDAGCGTGRYAEWLRARGARVTSLDRSMAMLARHPDPSRRVQGDLRSLPFPAGAFDLVVAGLALGEIPVLADALAELRRVLALGGDCVYSDFHPSWSTHGWRRTFRDAAGAEAELPLVCHSVDEHRHAGRAAGLRPVHVAEVSVRVAEAGAWRRSSLPALVVVHAVAE